MAKDAVEVVHDRLFNLPNVSDRDYQDFIDGLDDYFKEAAFEDRSVGIFGMTQGETLLANALMEFLKGRNAAIVHGRWEYHDCVCTGEGLSAVYSCSVCGGCIDEEVFERLYHTNHCPNCGAKMDGDGNG